MRRKVAAGKVYVDDAADPAGAMAEVMDGTPTRKQLRDDADRVVEELKRETDRTFAKAQQPREREMSRVMRGAGIDDTTKNNPFAPERGTIPKNAPKLADDFERIVERMFHIDAEKEYERLIRDLKIGERRTDRAIVTKAVDDAEDNARLAHALFCAATIEFAKWEAEVELVEAPMRSEATAELQREKSEGVRSKQITDADVRAKIAALHPDEFKYNEERRVRLRLLVDQMKRIADLWQSRCPTTRTILDKIR